MPRTTDRQHVQQSSTSEEGSETTSGEEYQVERRHYPLQHSTTSSDLIIVEPKSELCTLKSHCLLCSRDAPACLNVKHPTWPAIMRVVLFTLENNRPEKRYFSLRHDIYPLIDSHWDTLCTGKNASNWRKPMQDALSHGLNLFDSGREHHGTGFWGLKVHNDPWDSTEDCNVDESEDEDYSASPVAFSVSPTFPLSSGKRKVRDEEPLEARNIRSARQQVNMLREEMQNLENKLKGIKGEYEEHDQYSIESTQFFILGFTSLKDNVEREVQRMREMLN